MAWILLAVLTCAFAAWLAMVRMPGRSHRGALPPLTDAERRLAPELARHVRTLAGTIGERNVLRRSAYDAAARYIGAELEAAGWEPERQEFTTSGVPCANVWAQRRGAERADEIVVVGAHYDSVEGCPGANDNGSGVAALLALARSLGSRTWPRTLRVVAFANEEPPWFHGESMGSLRFAQACRERGERIVAMLSLETLGCYSDAEQSQRYPLPLLSLFYPTRGDFVAFVGNVGSSALVRDAIGTFRKTTAFPSEGACLPSWVPGVGWSDHWAFWQAGYDAIMVTDTAPFRYPHYHLATDRPEHVDPEKLARVVAGLERAIAKLLER